MIVFHHLPKTAGKSFRELLLRNYGETACMTRYGREWVETEPWRAWLDEVLRIRNKVPDVVAGHAANLLIPELQARGISFRAITFLRDPVDRCLSLHAFVTTIAIHNKSGRGADLGEFLLRRNWSLVDIYRRAEEIAGYSQDERRLFLAFFNGQARALLRPWNVEIPLGSMATTIDSEEQALEQVLALYDVGVVEHYDRSVQAMADAFGWTVREGPVVNVTPGRPSSSSMSFADIELVRAHNAIDLALHARYARRMVTA
jgi:hypothetical protein